MRDRRPSASHSGNGGNRVVPEPVGEISDREREMEQIAKLKMEEIGYRKARQVFKRQLVNYLENKVTNMIILV